MKQVVNFIKKYTISIIVGFIVLALGSFLIINFFNSKINIKTYNNKYISFNYDDNWNIDSSNKSDLSIELQNKNKGIINIKLLKLDDEIKYENLEKIVDNLLFDINKQNKNYNLIFKNTNFLTKKSLEGYEILYENGDSNVMLNITKNDNYLIIFAYEASNKYFDILLDSVQNIIYSFEAKEKKYELSGKLELNTEDISFSKNNNLDDKIKNNKEYMIANNNYSVTYTIPDIFSVLSLDSRLGSFNYKEGNINITTTVYNKNIYDYLDASKETGTLYEDFNYYKDNKDQYSNFIEQLSNFKISNYNGYLYKFLYTDESYNKKYENYYLIIPINKNHIFLIKIVGENSSITEKLVNSFEIKKVINYSSYIERKVKDGYFNIYLERLNYNYNDLVEIKLPEKYQEIDKKNNIYSYRYIGLNKDINNNAYQYNINYYLTSPYSNINSVIDFINSNNKYYQIYGDYTELKYLNTINLNGKNFQVYEANYYKFDNLFNNKGTSLFRVYEKVLIYELENGGELVITIDGNNKEIEGNLLQELSNITILKS